MTDVTNILSALARGDANATDELLPLVYEELRKLASAKLVQERPDQTLTATALVHEAYLRLVGNDHDPGWQNKGHFFASAAEAMRRILLNRARDRNRLKRGGNRQRLNLTHVSVAFETPPDILIDLDEAIQLLAQQDQVAADLIKLKFFAGLSLKDAAASLGMTRRQGDRLWAFARAWLFDQLQGSDGGS